MYQIFNMNGYGKSVSFNGDKFASFEDVRAKLGNIIAVFDIDAENDAADFMTKGGEVYAVERAA